MNFKKYIGYKLDDVKPILDENNIHYKIIETFDTKKTKLGNDIRIVNIKSKQNCNESVIVGAGQDVDVDAGAGFYVDADTNVNLSVNEIEIYVAYF